MKTIELTKKEYVAPVSKCVEIEEELLLQDSGPQGQSIMMLSDENETSAAQVFSMDSKDRGIFDFGFDE